MALYANTTNDAVEYVSRKDPARKNHIPKWIDEKDRSKGEILTPADIETFRQNGATVFKLKPLDVFLMGYIFDRASILRGTGENDQIDIHTRMNQTNIDAVRFGLEGFENFRVRGVEGGLLTFETEEDSVNGRDYKVASTKMLRAIRDITLVQELAEKIKQISEVSGDEEKKSGSESLPAV